MMVQDAQAHRTTWRLACGTCHQSAESLSWRCGACGGALEITNLPSFDVRAIQSGCWSLWRYAAMLPACCTCSLGEGCTPLIPLTVGELPFLAKLEFLAPTASYKDRGTVVLINHLLAEGAQAIVEDSSGNAGASLAAYAVAAGLQARVFAPEDLSPYKQQQIARFGATLVRVPGQRSAATRACIEAARQATYASHAWSPFFLAGQMTCAWEIWEQLGHRAPTAVVCPVGQGNLFLGLWRGFRALLAAGQICQMPRLYAVQSQRCAPLVCAWESGAPVPSPVLEQWTVAEGIRIADPVRGRELLVAIRESGGAALRVDEMAIARAQDALVRRGIFVEPTSAVPVAALPTICRDLSPDATIVVPLTGSGLKAMPTEHR